MKQYPLRNGQTITVRSAEEGDATAIERIVNSVASEKHYIVPEWSREDWDEAIREIRGRKSLVIVAQAGRHKVGMVHLVRGKLEKNIHVGFLGISILRQYRGVGVGTAMMNYMMEWAKNQEGLEKISLTVFSTNETAIDLYQKFGFKTEGVVKKQFKIEGQYVDDVVMGKFLHQLH
jgi:RimJ/RimL family protein N-acetyltransferase